MCCDGMDDLLGDRIDVMGWDGMGWDGIPLMTRHTSPHLISVIAVTILVSMQHL